MWRVGCLSLKNSTLSSVTNLTSASSLMCSSSTCEKQKIDIIEVFSFNKTGCDTNLQKRSRDSWQKLKITSRLYNPEKVFLQNSHRIAYKGFAYLFSRHHQLFQVSLQNSSTETLSEYSPKENNRSSLLVTVYCTYIHSLLLEIRITVQV